DVDAQLAQLLQEQRLRDVLMMVLVEDETDQVGPEVAAGHHLVGERGHQALPLGGLPMFPTVEDDAGPEDQILDDEVLVSLEDGPLRAVGQRDDDLISDGQLGGLGALGGAGAFGLGIAGRPGRGLEELGAIRGPGLRPWRRGLSCLGWGAPSWGWL